MNRFKKLSFTLVVCFALSVSLTASHSSQAAGVAGDAKSGESLFKGSCKQCHMVTEDALVGPGLKGVLTSKKKLENGKAATEANVRSVIKKGGGGMPSYEKKFTEAQIDDLIAYLKTL
ncbi:MAG: cytochrome c [Blastocatellia bacterium]|nr:cytochrome c [Blastocatellia bacterium]